MAETTLKARLATITPKMAEKLLAANTHNRSVAASRVDQYAADMWPATRSRDCAGSRAGRTPSRFRVSTAWPPQTSPPLKFRGGVSPMPRETTTTDLTCTECGTELRALAPDGRCGFCTEDMSMTTEEVADAA